MDDGSNQPIIADGQARAYKANIARVRAEVEREFSDSLAKAGYWRRFLLRLRMTREVRRRMDKVAPPWGLYSCNRSSDGERQQDHSTQEPPAGRG